MVTAASLVTLTGPLRVVMAFSLVTGNAALLAAGHTRATTEQTDLSIPRTRNSALRVGLITQCDLPSATEPDHDPAHTA